MGREEANKGIGYQHMYLEREISQPRLHSEHKLNYSTRKVAGKLDSHHLVKPYRVDDF